MLQQDVNDFFVCEKLQFWTYKVIKNILKNTLK